MQREKQLQSATTDQRLRGNDIGGRGEKRRCRPAIARRRRAPPAGAFGAAATEIRSELKMLAPNVYAFLQREAPGQSNFSVSNFGIVVGPRSLLAIDAGGGPQHARNFIAAAKPLGKPFDRVVITHEHPDHIVGLTQFPAGIEIVAQEETRAQMVKMGQPADTRILDDQSRLGARGRRQPRDPADGHLP